MLKASSLFIVLSFIVLIQGCDWKEQVRAMLGSEKKETALPFPKLPEIKTDLRKFDKKGVKAQSKVGTKDLISYYQVFLQELHFLLFQVEIPSSDFDKWFNVLSQGSGIEGVYNGFVLGKDYRRLELKIGDISKSCQKFVGFYLGKFLGQSISEDQLSRVGLARLKRVVIDRSLLMADALLLQNESDLYHWYGHFSSMLATKYPDLWKKKLRKIKKAKSHYLWAKKVPLKIIKGEIILKLHKVMNR